MQAFLGQQVIADTGFGLKNKNKEVVKHPDFLVEVAEKYFVESDSLNYAIMLGNQAAAHFTNHFGGFSGNYYGCILCF